MKSKAHFKIQRDKETSTITAMKCNINGSNETQEMEHSNFQKKQKTKGTCRLKFLS